MPSPPPSAVDTQDLRPEEPSQTRSSLASSAVRDSGAESSFEEMLPSDDGNDSGLGHSKHAECSPEELEALLEQKWNLPEGQSHRYIDFEDKFKTATIGHPIYHLLKGAAKDRASVAACRWFEQHWEGVAKSALQGKAAGNAQVIELTGQQLRTVKAWCDGKRGGS